MKNYKRIAFSLLTIVVLASCGKEENKDKPVVSVENVTDGSECTLGIINDTNGVASKCRDMKTRVEAKVCKDACQGILDKYPGLYCKGMNGLGQETYRKDSDYKRVVDHLTKMGI